MEIQIKYDGWTLNKIDKIAIDTGTKEYEPVQIGEVITVTPDDWTWSSGRLPLSLDDGATTYKYYIEEVEIPDTVTNVAYDPAGSEAGRSGMIATQGSVRIEVTNTTNEIPNGALKLTKVVKVNGENPESDQCDLVNGTYIFTMTGQDITKEVVIMVDEGEAKSATVDGSPVSLDDDGYVVISDLPEGDYTITETAVPGMTTTVSAGTSASGRTVTVHVTAGDTSAMNADAKAVFTNNKPFASTNIPVSKTMQGGNTPGTYSFTLTGESGAPMPTGSSGNTRTVTNTGETVSFGDIKFTLTDMADGIGGYATERIFIYTIQEVRPAGATEGNEYIVDGIRYDPSVYTVSVRVHYDSTEGTMTADEPTFSKNSVTVDEIGFVNEDIVIVPVAKAWSLDDSSIWPQEVKEVVVGLYVDDVAVNDTNDQALTLTLDADNPSGSFGPLPKYSSNTEIEYSVKEVSVKMKTNDETYTDSSSIKLADVFGPTEATGTITNKLHKASVRIVKVDKNDTEHTLTGASFSLVREKSDGTTVVVNDSISVDGQGKVTIPNLIAGIYHLMETVAPPGYKLTLKTITFKVDADGNVTYDDSIADTDNKWNHDNNMVTYTDKDSTTNTPSIFTICNEPGTALPSTGGSGTLIYTIAGMTLIVLAGVLLVSRRKRRT